MDPWCTSQRKPISEPTVAFCRPRASAIILRVGRACRDADQMARCENANSGAHYPTLGPSTASTTAHPCEEPCASASNCSPTADSTRIGLNWLFIDVRAPTRSPHSMPDGPRNVAQILPVVWQDCFPWYAVDSSVAQCGRGEGRCAVSRRLLDAGPRGYVAASVHSTSCSLLRRIESSGEERDCRFAITSSCEETLSKECTCGPL